ncbi:MAG: hypothetical protein IJ343_12365, partial [Clostridia bacterium]|nr:hypothetical protein [Clostridia bacterium]
VFPAYTENYMGRKAYDFADSDVTALNHVATLRKFGFTVEEIRRILTDPQESVGIVAEVRARKEETLRQEGENLDALSRLEEARTYTVAELAEKLAEPVREVAVPKEDRANSWVKAAERFLMGLAMLFVAVAPVGFLIGGLMMGIYTYRYAVFDGAGAVCIGITLLPTVVMLLLYWRKRRGKGRTGTRLAAVLVCLVLLPVNGFFSLRVLGPSVTTDIRNYRDFDAEFAMNNNLFAQRLFPVTARYFDHERDEGGGLRTVWLDARYYYRYALDFENIYDVYAEWPLESEDFDREIARVEALYAEELPDNYACCRIEKGSYTCLYATYKNRID